MTNPHDPSESPIRSATPRRRTLVAGAAWTIPVVAATTAAPFAAASTGGNTTITPVNPSLLAAECTPVNGLIFEVESAPGVPAANVAVAVTLPAGWTWDTPDTNPRTFLSDGTGTVTVTDARAGVSGTDTVYAQVLPSGPAAGVSVTTTAVLAREAAAASNLGAIRDTGGVPDGSIAIAWNVFLAPNGDLYSFHRSTGYTVVDTGVTSVAAQHYRGPSGAVTIEADLVTFVANGVAKTYLSQLNSTPVPTTIGAVPAGTTVVGWNSYLRPNGTLYHGTTPIASGVTSAQVQHYYSSGSGVTDLVTYTDASGLHTGRFNGGYTPANDFASVPAGSAVVGWNTALAPSGALYYQNGSIASGVASASAQHAGDASGSNEQDLVTWVTTTGVGSTRTFGSGAGSQTFTQSYGSSAKVVGWRTFLTGGRRLYLGNTLVDTNVLSADTFHEPTGSTPPTLTDWIAWTRISSCFA